MAGNPFPTHIQPEEHKQVSTGEQSFSRPRSISLNSQEDDPLFKVGVPSTKKIEQKSSGWLGGYVKTPAMLGGSDNSSYTVYILKTQITNL